MKKYFRVDSLAFDTRDDAIAYITARLKSIDTNSLFEKVGWDYKSIVYAGSFFGGSSNQITETEVFEDKEAAQAELERLQKQYEVKTENEELKQRIKKLEEEKVSNNPFD